MNKRIISILPAFLLALFLVPTLLLTLNKTGVAHAATFNVSIFHDEDDGTCDASCSIRDAISEATNGDGIDIPAGTYTLSATLGTLTVTESITFTGNIATDTFIDGQGNSRVFNVTAGTATFNGLTIQGGNSASSGGGVNAAGAASLSFNNVVITNNLATTNGGGIAIASGSLTLTGTQILSNTAGNSGGGIYSNNGGITFDNSQVLTNTAVSNGGGIYLNLASATLQMNSGQINDNTANTTNGFPGGGIHVAQGSATIDGGEIRNNQAHRGGGILVSSGQVTLNEAEIISNTATYGGGVYVVNTTGWFTQTAGLIATNESTATIDFGGGGLYIFNGNAALLGGLVTTNTAAAHGGGMEVRFGTLLVDGATISFNQAGLTGGGIYNSGGAVSIYNALIGGNDAQSHGGGIATNIDSGPSTTLIENSFFYGNIASNSQNGGGIFNGGILTATNSTISYGAAGNGAGLYNGIGGNATLTNVTIAGNISSNNGGGINNQGTVLSLANTIVAENSGAASSEDCAGTITSLENNLTQTNCGLTGSNDLVADPLLGSIDFNGGSTPVASLKLGSPAIDAGNNATCPATDQRGNLRPVGSVCDIGAYEYGIGFFISDASLTEGNSGSTQMSFIVSRSFMTDTTYTVDYETANNTALFGLDYTAVSNTITFTSGTMTQTVNVAILGDTLDEFDETFNIVLSNPSGASQLGDSTGVGTILDDDDQPTLTMGDVTATEGDSGTTTAVFTATLSAVSGKPITVEWETMAGTAVAGTDYVADSGTLLFNPGDDEETISITVNGDINDEFDETFTIALSNESNVTLNNSSAQATITDDDPQPTATIGNATVTEGDSGTVMADFTVTLSGASEKMITIDYSSADGSATAGEDYTAVAGTLTFNPGDALSQTISVTVHGDEDSESTEMFNINLTDSSNVTLGNSQGAGSISNDDSFILYLPIVVKP